MFETSHCYIIGFASFTSQNQESKLGSPTCYGEFASACIASSSDPKPVAWLSVGRDHLHRSKMYVSVTVAAAFLEVALRAGDARALAAGVLALQPRDDQRR